MKSSFARWRKKGSNFTDASMQKFSHSLWNDSCPNVWTNRRRFFVPHLKTFVVEKQNIPFFFIRLSPFKVLPLPRDRMTKVIVKLCFALFFEHRPHSNLQVGLQLDMLNYKWVCLMGKRWCFSASTWLVQSLASTTRISSVAVSEASLKKWWEVNGSETSYH